MKTRQAAPHQTWFESLESIGFDDWPRTLVGCCHVSQYGSGYFLKPSSLLLMIVLFRIGYFLKPSSLLADCVKYFQILEENELFVPSDDDDDD